MIASLLGGVLLREVPEALLVGVKSGQYKVFGSIIKSVSNGQIVGHLQEAGGLSKLASMFGSGPVGLLAGGVQMIQNEQIKSGIGRIEAGMGVLQSLGVANLALGAAGIGVSVAGFAVVSRKIEHVKKAVETLADRMDVLSVEVRAVRQDLVAADLDDLRALAWALDEGWKLGDSAAERRWHGVATDALRLSARFERHAARILEAGPIALPAADPMLDGLSLAGSLRVASLAAAGEVRAAQDAANEGARDIDALTGRIGHADLAKAKLATWKTEPGTQAWFEALTQARKLTIPDTTRLREREAAAATRAAPLVAIDAKGISARDWLAAARQETASPLLVMMHN